MKIAFLTAAFAFTIDKPTVPSLKRENKKLAVCHRKQGQMEFIKISVEKDTLPMILNLNDLTLPGQRLPDEANLFLDDDCNLCQHTRLQTEVQRRPLGEDYVFTFTDLPDAITAIDPLKVMVHTKVKGKISSGWTHVCVMDRDKTDEAAFCVGEVAGVGSKICDRNQYCVKEHVFRLDPDDFNQYKQNGEIVIKVDAPHNSNEGGRTFDPTECFAEVYLKYAALAYA